ncbi:MAG TPA: glycosyltransferase [Solirubrobacteraceae bacterium]|nr:glycosyltransferase [Solirubrobacteraceae bacterium]
MPELSVVIPTFRRHEVLARTLDALDRQTAGLTSLEVLVVDDAQEDDPDAVARAVDAERRPYPVRQLHRERPGVSAARNAGWRAAAAPLVLFLGDDMLSSPTLVAEHLDWHRRHPEAEVAVLGHVSWARELRVTGFMRWLEDGIQFDYSTLEGSEASWTHFYASNLSIKRALLDRSGGFDEERFPFGYEDLDLGRRLADLGMRLLYVREAEVEHLHLSTLEDWRGRMRVVAGAERRWVELHPELTPWFHDRLAEAAARRRVPRALGDLAARVPRQVPVLGRRGRALADTYFLQQLAPDFMSAWGRTEAR